MKILFGPFTQVLPMTPPERKGALNLDSMTVLEDLGILVENGIILELADFKSLEHRADDSVIFDEPCIALPSFIDAHTHICFAGSRAHDYTKRLDGKTYQEISAEGGGILDTVRMTRKASQEELTQGILSRVNILLTQGVATCEVKSGYGLTVEDELKMLRAIADAHKTGPLTLIPTCLAAHTCPPEFSKPIDYLNHLVADLLPQVQAESLSHRVDIFVERGAFSVPEARDYLHHAHDMGFALIVHADQFNKGGGFLAAELDALSADHLEVSGGNTLRALKSSGVIPIVLPGACIGLGIPFSPARKILDSGLPLVIASDWNPGSAPMGDLLTQAAIISAYEKLNAYETLAAITVRAASALSLSDRGSLSPGKRADITVFPTDDYREILYHQGSLKPNHTIIAGETRWSLSHGFTDNSELPLS